MGQAASLGFLVAVVMGLGVAIAMKRWPAPLSPEEPSPLPFAPAYPAGQAAVERSAAPQVRPEAQQQDVAAMASDGKADSQVAGADAIARAAALEARLATVTAGSKAKLEEFRLLTAGFPQERIEWLKQRRAQLLEQMKQADAYAAQNNAPRNPSSFAATMDNDLLLREEMSEEEYLKWRQALGKGTAFEVPEVLPGSLAERAGIRAGDQLIRYDNRRVFDYREIEALATDGSSGVATVELLRDGQLIRVVLPKGPTGLGARKTASSTIASGIQSQLFPR
jgi:membrane-associated protease RseP (regulator of RpoE activity)